MDELELLGQIQRLLLASLLGHLDLTCVPSQVSLRYPHENKAVQGHSLRLPENQVVPALVDGG